ncbi:ankyrin repeat-containing protein At5g02620-like isoform X2 [Carya illinoinensis]|uniref:PGG domain-containing protein n=1 Tax=Carya illinoinensis TaxID=32201 RepID=A0A8T1NPG4_CARIL|nr:ankyrin repeat-containing protein At5g02620-like isoform X2 [Carya illinoinensis]KAG6633499.1 hypothetical protein CIPAW_12G052000 [Carya illinoinensis]
MTTTFMHRNVYNAAAKGDISYFNNDYRFSWPLEALLTPNKNTVLHLFIKTFENGIESTENNFVRDILNMCPSLLCQVNVKDETPLHVAARYGRANIVEVLIEHAKYPHYQDLERGAEAVRKMLRMVNKEKDTALHEAVRYNHLKVTKLLIKEDPDFPYTVNDAGETPLYIAVERNYTELAMEILHKCKSPAYDGPLGRTALHAAILNTNRELIKAILEKIGGDITKKADQEGLTPLHLTPLQLDAYRDSGWLELLLEHDSQVAYMKDKEGRTALHIAAHLGDVEAMETIIRMCPDCCELVDNRGWNALHFAVEGDWPDYVMEAILNNLSFSKLLNEKDFEGNTPLHHQYSGNFTYRTKDLMNHPGVDKMAFNKSNHNAYQVAITSGKLSAEEAMQMRFRSRFVSRRVFFKEEQEVPKDLEKQMREERKKESQARMKEYLDKAGEAHLVVAALITTVTFATAITMPGGFVGTGGDPHYEGSAILRRNAAFKAFIITDAISLVLSSTAVVIHLFLPLLFRYSESEETRYDFLNLAFQFILMAMGAMVLAFITGRI